MKAIVVGGSGFIGSHLVDALIARGDEVTIYDKDIPTHLSASSFIKGDALDLVALESALAGKDVVFHLSANPEARTGLTLPLTDLYQGTVATNNVLEAMRRAGVPEIVFASSGTVYGERSQISGEADLGCLPISLYGASKLAGEALISAYVECFGIRGRIVRFGNVVGSRGTHGAFFDFRHKLRTTGRLEVHGNGQQRKPFLHVSDCVAGIMHVQSVADKPLEVYNLAPAQTTTVAYIANASAKAFGGAEILYGEGPKGWPGDVATSQMSAAKLWSSGFTLRRSSNDAVDLAVKEMFAE